MAIAQVRFLTGFLVWAIFMECGMKEIQLTQGKVALVDDEDYDELCRYNWVASSRSEKCYVVVSIKMCGKWTTIAMHRFLIYAPKGMDIDHINRNRLDNRKCNLRVCTRSQNTANSPPQNGTSVFKGVSWDKRSKKWHAMVYRDGKAFDLGCHNCGAKAAKQYDAKAKELYGEFAYLNFPERRDE